MAIVMVRGDGGGLERRVGLKAAAKKTAKKAGKKAAKKGAKHAIEKHAAKKHPAKKHAEKHAGKKAAKHVVDSSAELSLKKPEGDSARLSKAFHKLQRAAAVISLLEKPSGGDLRALLELAVEVFERAGKSAKIAKQAGALAKAVEHLAMAGLYSARIEFRVNVAAPAGGKMQKRLRDLRDRLEDVGVPKGEEAEMLTALGWELLKRADAAGDDPHMEYELGMAADALCEAVEEGI